MPTSAYEWQYPKALREAEQQLIAERRKAAAPESERATPVVGLALSGGGIRSATFCLGVLQALAESKIVGTKDQNRRVDLSQIDLLSTVSGGGYIGSFLGAMFARDTATPDSVRGQLTRPDSAPVHWLRENGRYLAPNGSGDRWLALATMLRNWMAVALTASVLVLTVLMLGQWMEPAARGFAQRHSTWPMASSLFSLQSSGIYWSPFLGPLVIVVVFVATPLGWAYWLGRFKWRKFEYVWIWILTLVVTAGAAFEAFAVRRAQPPGTAYDGWSWLALGIVGSATLVLAIVLTLVANDASDSATSSRGFRNLTSRWLTGAVIAAAAILGIAFIDTLGRTAYMHLIWHYRFAVPASFATAVGVLLTAARKLMAYLENSEGKNHIAIPLGVVGAIAGIVATALLLGALSTVSYGIARGWETHPLCPADVPSPVPAGCTADAGIAVGVLIVLTFLLGRSLPFVNLSSLTQFYSARLSRTYIGASNDARQKDGKTTTEEVPGDDLDLSAYRPHAHGGPLHLINVTLNETVGGASQVLDRDRKGLAMAIGPAGMSIGVTHHATWSHDTAAIIPLAAPDGADTRFRIWRSGVKVEAKRLSLSQWTAISGAAVATGMGSQTSLGLSLLFGIANVRLGYWWDSKAKPREQTGTRPSIVQRVYEWALPVQSALTDEFLAQFRGPHRRYWYLTDGGHFENTAAYELVRRRVPLIIICDDGADPEYSFQDLANLVRKARLDFDAEVEFLTPDDKLALHVGTLDDVKSSPPFKTSRRHLIVARITYGDADQIRPSNVPSTVAGRAQSIVVVVKPSLTGDEPLDVLQYAASHPSFPQESTADQFFDEAQWESYRRLGQHIGQILASLDVRSLIQQPLST